MQILILSVLLVSSAATWIGEEYWIPIGRDGQLRERSTVDFARLDGNDNQFVAFWITRTRYEAEHFEAFGHGYIQSDGRICAIFAGFHREPIEICGGFRVLSVPPRLRGQKIFEWIPASQAHDVGTVGYLAHRIAKLDGEEIIYGDAIPNRRSFVAAKRGDPQVLIESPDGYLRRVWLLRLLVPEIGPAHTAAYQPRAYVPPPPAPVIVPPRIDLICDQHGNAYERRNEDGRILYVPYDSRLHGGVRPYCPPFVSPVIATPPPLYIPPPPYVPPPPQTNVNVLLPDHHDGSGNSVGDADEAHGRDAEEVQGRESDREVKRGRRDHSRGMRVVSNDEQYN